MSEPSEQHLKYQSLIPKILDRYVAREFLVSYVIALAVVLSLRVILDLFVEFDEFVEARSGQFAPGAITVIGYIASYYGPKIFEFFRDFSGTIVLLAAAFSLTRLTRQNELTAVLASGVSLKRVIAPIVLLGFLLNLLMVIDQEFILPRIADKLVRENDEMETVSTVEDWQLPDRDGALFSTPGFNYQTGTLLNLQVIHRQDGQAIGVTTARSAQWDQENQLWRLDEGVYTEISGSEGFFGQISQPREVYQSAITPEYLWLQRHANFKSLMSSSELTGLMRRDLKDADRKEALGEKHFRFTDPVINMVMLLLGLPLLVTRERRSTKTAIFLVILGSGGCFVATFACKLLAGEALSPLLAAWLPIIVFMPLSVLALDSIKT